MKARDTRPPTAKSLQWYLKELVCQSFLKEYVLTLGASTSTGQPSAPPPAEPQHAITQYKAIE